MPHHEVHHHREFLASLYTTDLFKKTLVANVASALAEDIATGDIHQVLYPSGQESVAHVITRQDGVMCGRPWVVETFRQLNPQMHIQWFAEEGGQVTANQKLFEISGPTHALLSGERTALNFMQCLMATATACAALSVHLQGTKAHILDTRKTLPGLRLAQKYAVVQGGGLNHRIGLWDAFLLKENHIAAAGGITAAVLLARQYHPERFLEVEVETLIELEEALHAQVDQVLLDNFTLEMLEQGVALRHRLNASCDLEASGNITEQSIRSIALTGVDFISIGALTKNIQAIDLSLQLEKIGTTV